MPLVKVSGIDKSEVGYQNTTLQKERFFCRHNFISISICQALLGKTLSFFKKHATIVIFRCL
ncbi:hypothetical protein D1164_20800 [Mariniphaga sediminis]|uniref:Uncharacterized protein n=1 Tax=Mariniphaga sediminis TaxID=1628158 RepID=A0A399CTR8_9BACT|nr:hypothetical protein D1164_20800 [Mariniphaga sediminis]